ncbi:MAG: glycosyltransferase [Acetobacter sp.]|nr:glycosyltransferase [Acetobacter sp.]
MNNSPKISIIIPIYNTSAYLPECLNSIIKQTLKNIEIICINDGSTDNSLAILNEYAQKDQRIKIINQKNLGISYSRNNALKIASGEYIQFLDSDDWIREDTCQQLYTTAHTQELDMLSFSGYNVNNKTKELLNENYFNFTYLPSNFDYRTFHFADCQHFCEKMGVTACLTLYRRKFIEQNNLLFPKGLHFEDNLFFTQALFAASLIGINKEKFYFRRIHSASITQNQEKHYLDNLKITDLVLSFIKAQGNEQIYARYKKSYTNSIITKYKRFSSNYQKAYKTELNKILKKYTFSQTSYYLFGFIPFLRIEKNSIS